MVRCAQLDDFKWFLPAEERAGDLTALESEIEMLDSESEVEYIEPDSTPVQMETTAQQLRCPPVVAQTKPMEGCHTALLRQLCRGRDVLMEDGAVAVDTRQVSAASDSVVSQEIRMWPDNCAYVGCGASDRLRGCSAETSRLLLHRLTPAGGRVSRFAQL